MKNIVFGAVVVVLIIVGVAYWGYKNNGSVGPKVAGESESTPNYFDDSANVMYFYQDSCSWCIKEKVVLKQLGDQGYRVKSMNIGSNYPDNQKYWKEYNISGTPAFVAKNNDRLEGYQNFDTLKAFLDLHK